MNASRFARRPSTGLRTLCLSFIYILAAGVFLGMGSGCSRSESKTPASAGQSGSSDPAEKRFPLTGEVVSADPAHNQITVMHQEVKGYMPAMTMEFAVNSGDAANAKPGQKIRAELVVPKDGKIRLEKIWPASAAETAEIDAAAKALNQDTVIRGNGAYREVGEQAPQFTLYDQDGKVVQSSRFQGKQIMINFIFSRCPIANMCPASTARFQQTQKAARESGVKNLELISITLDPAYDTPGVLKEYAAVRGIDTSNFSFLTGPENAIKSLLTQFGVIAEFDGDLLKHTLSTLLIDENGKIIHRADGSTWDVQEFVSLMKR